jgi:Fe-S-cluster containining protein
MGTTQGKTMQNKCHNCGECCQNITTQINVTVGDTVRLSEFLKMPIKNLIPKYIDINPFGTPGSSAYEWDLGLNIPCQFRENERCTVYEARPLNCRLFPAWIIANAPLFKVKEVIDEQNRCRNNEYTDEDKRKSQIYVKHLGRIFERESRFTDEMLSFLPDRTIRMSDVPGYGLTQDKERSITERKKEAERILLLLKLKKDYPMLAEKIARYKDSCVKLTELNQIERDTKPF